jgi:hypothetical protein
MGANGAGRPLESTHAGAAIGHIDRNPQSKNAPFGFCTNDNTELSCHVSGKTGICILSTSLLSKITQTLHQDESLMAQLEDLQVTSRVKEPSPFGSCSRPNQEQLPLSEPSSIGDCRTGTRHSTRRFNASDPLAITGVQDAVALRRCPSS